MICWTGARNPPGETRTRLLLAGFGLPMPSLQVQLRTWLGLHRVDFAWEDIRLILEFDGSTKYFDYRPTAEVLVDERRRENALTEDHWSFIRIQWKDLELPDQLQARLLAAMESARARTAALVRS